MLLAELLQKCPAGLYTLIGDADVDICGIAYDSRRVRPGYLFVAVPGDRVDGHAYIGKALELGAVAVLAQYAPDEPLPDGVPLLLAHDTRRDMGALAAAFYGFPAASMRCLALTGTNGKTTGGYILRHLLEQGLGPAGMIGTVENWVGQRRLPAVRTTPEALELQQLLAEMRDSGCRYLVMEASSHALVQGRCAAVPFVGAVYTNLSRDHLDYHGTIEAYAEAKSLLFRSLPADGCAVINIDDEYAAYFAAASNAPVITYGRSAAADFRIGEVSCAGDGMRFTLTHGGQDYPVYLPLVGMFNIYNAVAALALAVAEGLPVARAAELLATTPQIPGRMEQLRLGQPYVVAVDYAHTPDGLLKVLQAARDLQPQRIICVFGCGGDRDHGKRPVMGRIGCENSDIAIITSDNPRSEQPQAIIDDILAGCAGCANYRVVIDRAEAIAAALNEAKAGDVVIIAGKGHETYQEIGGEKLHFDDREAAAQVLRESAEK